MHSNYFLHHHTLLQDFYEFCRNTLPFSSSQQSDTDAAFISRLQQLSQASADDEHYRFEGQQLLTTIIGHYPHLSAAINRDLLWFFGGDCLHFMSDEEIARYQQVEEVFFHQGRENPESYSAIKANIFKLH